MWPSGHRLWGAVRNRHRRRRGTEDVIAIGAARSSFSGMSGILSLWHVGYGTPTDFFSPVNIDCWEVARGLTENDMAVVAVRRSSSLVSRMLTRVTDEGPIRV